MVRPEMSINLREAPAGADAAAQLVCWIDRSGRLISFRFEELPGDEQSLAQRRLAACDAAISLGVQVSSELAKRSRRKASATVTTVTVDRGRIVRAAGK